MGIRGEGKYTTKGQRKWNDNFMVGLEKYLSVKCPTCGHPAKETKNQPGWYHCPNPSCNMTAFQGCPNEVTVVTKGCGNFPGLIVARISVMSGETVYSVAVTRYGGLWIKGDWVGDTYWNPIGDKALEQDYPGTMAEILSKLPVIKAWQESLP